MYYISFDEAGDFENSQGKRDSSPLIIAGVVFDADEDEINNEFKRIDTYYKSICESVECIFPSDLHVDNGSNYGNKDSVKKVKGVVGETLSVFLSDGDYPGKDKLDQGLRERKGKYYLFAYVKGSEWKGERRKLPSEIADDEKASNLYLHMAQDMVSRIVFHNPKFPEKKEVILDIPTRRFVYDSSSRGHSEFIMKMYDEEFEDQGYRKIYNNAGERIINYDVGNGAVYRIAIERELINYNNTAISIKKFMVRSISYKPERAFDMGFLYLADSINSILGYRIVDYRNCISEIYGRLSKLIKDENVVFYSYDDLDTLYGEAFYRAENGDLFEAFSHLYDACQLDCESKEYYVYHPIKDLCDWINKNASSEDLTTATRKLSRFAYNNEVDRNKLLYLFKKIEELGEYRVREGGAQEEVRNLFLIYDVGISVFSHLGDSRKAECYYKKCITLKEAADVKELIVLNNKMIVFLSDMFAYKKAYILACKNVKKAEAYAEFRSKYFKSDRADVNTSIGLAYSQLGQVCSVYKRNEAEKAFKKALRLLRRDKKNYNITLSYYLHFLIEKGDDKEYFTWIKRYLGGKEKIIEQMRYIFEAGSDEIKADQRILNPEFALYVWLKGIYTYNLEFDNKVLSSLKYIDTVIKSERMARGKGSKNHPWEMIYKYIALILLRKDNEKDAERFIEKALAVNDGSEQILKAISLNTRMRYAEIKGDRNEAEKYFNELINHIASMNDGLKKKLTGKNKEECYRIISKNIRYMYS